MSYRTLSQSAALLAFVSLGASTAFAKSERVRPFAKPAPEVTAPVNVTETYGKNDNHVRVAAGDNKSPAYIKTPKTYGKNDNHIVIDNGT